MKTTIYENFYETFKEKWKGDPSALTFSTGRCLSCFQPHNNLKAHHATAVDEMYFGEPCVLINAYFICPNNGAEIRYTSRLWKGTRETGEMKKVTYVD